MELKNKNQFYLFYYLFAVTGLILGAFIDTIFTQMLYVIDPKKESKGKLLIVLLLQVAANGVLLAMMLHKKITIYIMSTLPGIIFSGLLFGIQSNLYVTMQTLLGYQNKVNWPWWKAPQPPTW